MMEKERFDFILFDFVEDSDFDIPDEEEIAAYEEQNNQQTEEEEPQKPQEEESNAEEQSSEDTEEGGSEAEDNTEEENGGAQETPTKTESGGSSPSLYSSLTSALSEEGVFSSMSKEDLKDVNDAESFLGIINKEIDSRLDARMKRIEEALNAGVQQTDIQAYQQSIDNLNNVTDELLNADTDQSKQIRYAIIKQDFLNQGMSEEAAEKKTQKSFARKDDKDDAADALESCKRYYNKQYDDLVAQEKAKTEEHKQKIEQQSKKLRADIIDKNEVLDMLGVDKTTRELIYNNINKATYTDESGRKMTVLQKYQKENPVEFAMNVGIIHTLTDGFKDWSKLFSKGAKKEISKGMKQLEQSFNAARGGRGGQMKMISGVTPRQDDGSDWTQMVDV